MTSHPSYRKNDKCGIASYIAWSQEEGVKGSMWCIRLSVAPILVCLRHGACLSRPLPKKHKAKRQFLAIHKFDKVEFGNVRHMQREREGGLTILSG